MACSVCTQATQNSAQAMTICRAPGGGPGGEGRWHRGQKGASHWREVFLPYPGREQSRLVRRLSRALGSPIINNSVKTPTYNQHKYIAVDHRGFGLALAAAGWVSLAPSGQRGWRLHRRLHGHHPQGLFACIVSIWRIRVFLVATFACLVGRMVPVSYTPLTPPKGDAG